MISNFETNISVSYTQLRLLTPVESNSEKTVIDYLLRLSAAVAIAIPLLGLETFVWSTEEYNCGIVRLGPISLVILYNLTSTI